MRRLARLVLWGLAAIGGLFVLFVLWLVGQGPLFAHGVRAGVMVAPRDPRPTVVSTAAPTALIETRLRFQLSHAALEPRA